MDALVVLVHSPLVGPSTWFSVADQLGEQGIESLVPALRDRGSTPPIYRRQLAASFQEALAAAPVTRPLVLVGHSGAGPLLPTLADAIRQPVHAFLYVDAALPHPGQSQLEEMDETVPAFAGELRELLARGGRYPRWTDDDLRAEIPDPALRRLVLAEQQPRGLDYFTEVGPDQSVSRWPAIPAGYLRFTDGYQRFFDQARQAGWPVRALPAGHFEMLVHPAAVATTLVDLLDDLGVTSGG